MKHVLYLLLFIFTLSACDLLEDNDILAPGPDIVAGLKQALEVGTDSATNTLGAIDGYLRDEAVKILLPDEMEEQISKFKAINVNIPVVGNLSGEQIYNSGIPLFGVSSLASVEDNLITGINRAAESAATEAAPIFVDAITGITFADANNILFGPDNAATQFFKDNTFDGLFNTYEPKIDAAISSVTIGDASVEDLYASFVNSYNEVLTTNLGITTLAELTDLETMAEPDLSTHATNKGLDGLFLKVEQAEADIRNDPIARVTDLLKDVFGLQD